MINTISTSQAVTELLKDEYAQWSHEAATALVDWMEELEESTGEPIEFDPVALRCEFSEYTEAELLVFLETGWGEGNITDLQLSFLHGPDDQH